MPAPEVGSVAAQLLDPNTLEASFRRWVSGIIPALEGGIAIDGKTLRGSAAGGILPAASGLREAIRVLIELLATPPFAGRKDDEPGVKVGIYPSS